MKIFKLLAIIATFTQLSTSLYFDRTSLANKVIELPIWRQAISGDDLQWKEIRKRARKRLLPTVLVNQPVKFLRPQSGSDSLTNLEWVLYNRNHSGPATYQGSQTSTGGVELRYRQQQHMGHHQNYNALYQTT